MAKKRRPSSKPLRRPVAVRKPRRTLLVFCEGRRTEPEYLEAVKRDPAVREVAAVDLRIERFQSGSVPLVLVQRAVEARRRAIEEEAEIDEFWCVFDVEWPHNHPGLRSALDLATRHDIRVAVSNPCFELWLILHFQDCARWLNNDEARRLRRSHDRSPDKGIDGRLYLPRSGEAMKRARRLDEAHARAGRSTPHDNPSSGMYRLLAAITGADPGRAGD